MEEGVDYCFITSKDEGTTPIKVLTGKFAGTLFRYGKVKIGEDDPHRLQFAFFVIESTYKKPKKLEKDAEFKQYAGDMLVHLVETDLEEELDGDISETDN